MTAETYFVDLFFAWELVDVSSPSGGNGQQETLYLLSSRYSSNVQSTASICITFQYITFAYLGTLKKETRQFVQ